VEEKDHQKVVWVTVLEEGDVFTALENGYLTSVLTGLRLRLHLQRKWKIPKTVRKLV
jgi:hypothetical protein